MGLTASKQAGCALAALLAGDRDLSRVRGALEPQVAEAVADLVGPRTIARGERVAALLARVRPQLRTLPSSLPPRLVALLAPRLPRGVAQPLLASVPAMRATLVLDETLLPPLLRIARSEAARGPA